MRAQMNMQTAVNRPLRERLGSLILGQSLTVWGRSGHRVARGARSKQGSCRPSVFLAQTRRRPKWTIVRWHRAGFCRYWRWKSRSVGGRPQIDADLRALIRRMSVDNLLWGAPRIHGSCSSSALRSLSRPSPSIWSGEPTRSGRAGARFCVTMRHTSQPWICSWSRPSALTALRSGHCSAGSA